MHIHSSRSDMTSSYFVWKIEIMNISITLKTFIDWLIDPKLQNNGQWEIDVVFLMGILIELVF